jgi:HK97 family phage prohead protease
MKTRLRTLNFEIKSADTKADGVRYFEGYAAATNNVDSYGEILAPGCFAQDLPKFLADGFIGGLNHNWDQPIGRPVAAAEDQRGLYCRAELVDTPHAAECHTLIKAGVCRKLSIGFRSLTREFVDHLDDVRKYWDSVSYTPTDEDLDRASHGATILRRVRLYELSPVMKPANEACEITHVKAGATRGGLRLEEQLDAALAAVAEACERTEQVAAKRAESGRSVSPARRATLLRIRDRVDAALRATASTVDPEEVLRLQADLLALDLEALS